MLLARRGYAQLRQGNIALALADLDEAIRVNPAEAYFYMWRGSVLIATNQLDKALADVNHAIELKPKEALFYSLRGFLYTKQESYQKAVQEFERAIALNPGGQEGYNNLAWLRATCPSGEFRDGPEAVRLATKAAELTRFSLAPIVDTLAAAYAEAQDFEKAIKYQKSCLELIAGSKSKPNDEMRSRLELYQNHKPFHQPPPGTVAAH